MFFGFVFFFKLLINDIFGCCLFTLIKITTLKDNSLLKEKNRVFCAKLL